MAIQLLQLFCVLLTSGFEWEWDDHFKSSGAFLSCDNRKVSFHSDYSCGTAAIRGTKELTDGQHFWEVKMTSLVYGTDMVGIIYSAKEVMFVPGFVCLLAK